MRKVDLLADLPRKVLVELTLDKNGNVISSKTLPHGQDLLDKLKKIISEYELTVTTE